MKDNLQLIAQVVLIVLGPILLKHGITVGNDQADKILGGLSELIGILWKFMHWNLTPSATPGSNETSSKQTAQSGFMRPMLMLLIAALSLLFVTGCRFIDGLRQFDGRAAISHVRGILFLLTAGVLILFNSGCAAIAPGNDPLVVNVERAQTVAAPTFDMVLTVDNSRRPFFQTNAPAFHNFCEWLRAPQAVTLADGSATNVQRAIAMQLNLDNVKLAYKSGRASSNTLVTAMATLQSAAQQASAWLTIATNQP